MDTEALAVAAVKKEIAKTGYLVDYIKDKEKEPMWDGAIYSYSSSEANKKNEDFTGKAAVQVKGYNVETLKISEIKYDVDVVSLKNFKSYGGVLFFVVAIDKEGETKIFCRSLTPFIINNLLQGKETQKSVRIMFNPFPVKVNDICNYVTNFIRDSKKQKIFEQNSVPSLEEFLLAAGKDVKYGFQISRYGFEGINPFNILVGQEFYIYATNTKLNVDFPVQHINRVEKASRKVEKQVTIDGKLYYDHILYVLKEEGFEIHIGKGIEIDVIEESRRVKINYNLKGNIREQIQDSQFLIDFFTARKIEISGVTVFSMDDPTEEEEKAFHIDDVRARHDYLKSIDDMLISLGIDKPLEIDNLSEKEETYLSVLKIAFLQKQPVHFYDVNLPAVGGIAIGNLYIMLYFKDAGEGNYYIGNFPDANIDVEGELAKGERFKTSKYVIMKADDIARADNFKFQDIVNDLMRIQNDGHFLHCNNVLLEMIKAFDKEKKKEFLEEATRLAEWLLQASCLSGISEINYFQCLYRNGNLGTEQEDRLIEMLDEYKENDQILACIHILLGNEKMAKRFIEKMDEETRNQFEEFPIYKLFV